LIRFEILEKIKKSLQFIYKFTFLTHHMHYFVQCLRERKRLEGRVRKQSGEQSLAGSFWTTQQPETDIAPNGHPLWFLGRTATKTKLLFVFRTLDGAARVFAFLCTRNFYELI